MVCTCGAQAEERTQSVRHELPTGGTVTVTGVPVIVCPKCGEYSRPEDSWKVTLLVRRLSRYRKDARDLELEFGDL